MKRFYMGSPIFPSGCEGKLGVALESLQGRRDLTYVLQSIDLSIWFCLPL